MGIGAEAWNTTSSMAHGDDSYHLAVDGFDQLLDSFQLLSDVVCSDENCAF